MTRFVLRCGERAFALRAGEQIVGRGEDADVLVDDPLASRHHARLRVSELAVEIDDLGSRNGVVVDGQRIGKPTVLSHGAVISIASQRFVLVDLRQRADPSTMRVEVPRPPGDRASLPSSVGTTRATASVASLVVQARAALGGDPQHLRALIKCLLAEVTREVVADEELARDLRAIFGEGALHLAEVERAGHWLDAIFELHARLRVVIDRDLMHRVAETAAALEHRDPSALDRYLATILDASVPLDATASATLRRLRALRTVWAGGAA